MGSKQSEIKMFAFTPTKTDHQKRRWVLDDLDVPTPQGFTIARGAFVHIGPGGWAANHRHERQELLLGLSGELYLIWRDSKGIRHEEKMVPADGTLQLYSIPSWTPHLVENRSEASGAVLHEWSDIEDQAEDLVGGDSLRLSEQ